MNRLTNINDIVMPNTIGIAKQQQYVSAAGG